jgi:nucleoside-diphosphate-sugar epimerase
MKKLLVTGGTGSLGTAILNRATLENWNTDITVLARNETNIATIRSKFPHYRAEIGDVRDLDWLRTIVPGHDVVIHAAALKIVPVAEINVKEAVTCNVLGTTNIAIACAEADVHKAILISSDKACLSGNCPITLADGSTKLLRQLVEEKYSGEVVTVDPTTNTRKLAKVIGWHHNNRRGRTMLRVSYKDAHKRKGLLSGPIVTEDHQILTINGWKEAGNLTDKDILVTHEPSPNWKQKALLIGTLLGDSSLSKPKNGNQRSQLRMGHHPKEYEWLNIKRNILIDFGMSNIKLNKHKNFSTTSSKYLACMLDLQRQFYPQKEKIVPRELVWEYFSPILVATWYMDDGYVSKTGSSLNARIATHGFSEEDVEWSAELFSKQGMICACYPVKLKDYGTYYELRFTVQGTIKLFEYIRSFVPESMSHKIDYVDYNELKHTLDNNAVPFLSEAVIDKDVCQHPHGVYCLDIEGTNAFVSSEVVVHNCGPTYYGVTKRLGEGLFREANNWRSTKFISVRYGNVLRSANSIVPLFERLMQEDKPFTITNFNMTRFFMSMRQAIDLILYALNKSEPGTITVPKMPAMKITDLAAALDVDREQIEIGIRPGERLNETLIVQEESMHTVDIGKHFIIYPPTADVASNLPFQYEYVSNDPVHWIGRDEILALLGES